MERVARWCARRLQEAIDGLPLGGKGNWWALTTFQEHDPVRDWMSAHFMVVWGEWPNVPAVQDKAKAVLDKT